MTSRDSRTFWTGLHCGASWVFRTTGAGRARMKSRDSFWDMAFFLGLSGLAEIAGIVVLAGLPRQAEIRGL